jgi:hypothetical protein
MGNDDHSSKLGTADILGQWQRVNTRMKIQDKLKQRVTTVELSVAEFLLLIVLAAWGIGTLAQQWGF